MLRGRMTYGYGSNRYVMRPGDALEFEGDVPHGPVELTKLPITFLSVIATGAVGVPVREQRSEAPAFRQVLGRRTRAPRPRGRPWPRAWRASDLRGAYDVVIVGAGVHGLATAYYLAARWGITNVAVLDKGYIGGGGSGRNTAIVRSNYLTPRAAFYDRSVKLYEELAAELNFNVMFSQRGHLTWPTTTHHCGRCGGGRVNKLQGVDSEVIGPDEIARLVPFMDVSEHTRYPILGALYHPPGGTIRHDAVNWGYARAAGAMGVDIHQQTEVVGIDVVDGQVAGVTTARAHRHAGRRQLHRRLVVAGLRHGRSRPADRHASARGGRDRAGQAVPRTVVVSGTLHVYVSQTDRGELVFGASTDSIASYSMRRSLAASVSWPDTSWS